MDLPTIGRLQKVAIHDLHLLSVDLNPPPILLEEHLADQVQILALALLVE
jgi:hypothetical protein